MYNKITIVGNLGRDPEMRYMPDGKAVTNLSVATSERWTDKKTGQPQERTTWFKVAVWGRSAENCNQYLQKGSKVLVEGQMAPDPATGGPRIWQRASGEAGASYEVKAFNVVFLNSKGQGGDTAPLGNDVNVTEDDDMPF